VDAYLQAGLDALADSTRMAIFQKLAAGPLAVNEIAEKLPVTRPAVSQHLKVLKDAGLVTDRRDGRWSYYTLTRDAFLEAEELLSSLRPKASRSLKVNCC